MIRQPHPIAGGRGTGKSTVSGAITSELAEEFRDYARRGGQVFVSTHSPDFLERRRSLEEIFWLVKREMASPPCVEPLIARILQQSSSRAQMPGVTLETQIYFEGAGLSSGQVNLSYSKNLLCKSFWKTCLPRLFPGLCRFMCVPHEGKDDLEDSSKRRTPQKLAGLLEHRFVVVRDNDDGDCYRT